MASVWRQWEDGFDLTVVKTSCTATVDAANHNKLTATIAAGADDSDMAEGRVNRTAKLSANAEGYLRWKFTTPAAFSLANNSSIALVKAGSNTVADLYIDSALNVNLFVTAGVLATAAQNPSAATTLVSSTTYTFELWWKQNQALKLAINGVTVVNTTGLSGSSLSAVETERRLGIDHYDGASGTGWTAIIDQAQAGDSFTDSFTDPAVPVISVAPVLSGVPDEGSPLTVDDGTWTSTLPITSYAFQYKRDGGAIAGAVGQTYDLVPTDVGHSFLCQVIAQNSWGMSTAASSNTVGPVTAALPTAGTGVTSDVPSKYDVIIDGHGYVFLDSLDPSIPFRTHRAVYGQTQPFVERQNVSNAYGDNAQDFFLTIRQRDWSLGEQQKYFRAGNDGRYWMGQGVEVSTPGQVTLSPSFGTLTFPGTAVVTTVRNHTNSDYTQNVALSATKLYTIDASGTIVDKGVHGLGAAPSRWGSANDNNGTLISTSGAGTVGVRYWNGSSFSTFSATGADSLAYLNNTLFGFSISGFKLMSYDTSGTPTTLFTWQAAGGGAGGFDTPRLAPFGGKLLIGSIYAQEASELWIYDGTGTSRLEVFPENFYLNDIEVLYGVAYVSGSFTKRSGTDVLGRPAILFYDGTQIGKLWQANDYGAVPIGTALDGPHPAMGVNEGRLIFTDETTGNLMAYNPELGGVSSIGTFTPSAGDEWAQMASSPYFVAHIRHSTTGYYFPAAIPASGYVISSLIDFDSSLAKVFRGVTIDWDAASDGDGGSVDIAYQIDGLDGTWTTLKAGAVAGHEYPGDGTSIGAGHSIAFKVTLNKGTSTAGPTYRSMNVRGAPVMPVYPRGEYILDCTSTVEQPRELRDNSLHPLVGYDQVQNLVAAKNSLTPVSVTDKVNGTYTAFVDVNDPEGFDVYEVHPSQGDASKPGSYVVRLTMRGV